MKKHLPLIKILTLVFFSSLTTLNAQDECGFDHVNSIFLRDNPEIKERLRQSDQRIANALLSGQILNYRINNGFIEIPVVIHHFTDGRPLGSLGNLTDEQLLQWIEYTNQLYAATAHSNRASTVYPFKLVLAKRTINNEPTNGIVRVDKSNNAGYVSSGLKYNGATGISEADAKNESRWNPKYYYNIYVFNKIDGFDGTSGGGTNGYAYVEAGAGTFYDGAFHHAGVVGRNKATLGHEIGHALGLLHVFGNASSTCENPIDYSDPNHPIFPDPYTTGDLVPDTSPTINGNNYYTVYSADEPVGMTNTCTGQIFDDIIWNVLNYGSRIRSVFTPGQAARSVEKFYEFRSSLITSLGGLPPSEISKVPQPSCTISGNNQNSYFRINEIHFGTLNISGASSGDYVDNTSLSNIDANYSTDLVAGETIPLTIKTLNGSNRRKYSVYIDLNDNGIFDANEVFVDQKEINDGIYTTTDNITIPTTAVKNKPLRMRVVGALSNTYGGFNDVTYGACDYRKAGQVVDYSVTIVDGGIAPCGDIKNDFEAYISSTQGDGGSRFYLESYGFTENNNYSYQWQKSEDALNWIDIAGATTKDYEATTESTNAYTKTFYRLKVLCSASNQEYYSKILTRETLAIASYCEAGAIYSNYSKILNVNFADINNSSTTLVGYENFTSIVGNVERGRNYSLSTSFSDPENVLNNLGDLYVWIDFNQNGSFEENEKVVNAYNPQSTTVTNNIQIPTTAKLGKTRMRIRLQYKNQPNSNSQPCGYSGFGQVEDYTVNIQSSDLTILDNGTWSNGTPTITKNAIIRDVYEVANDVSAKSIKTEYGGKVVVKSGHTLTVENEITNNYGADKFVVESGANLLQLSEAANVGLATVYRNSQPMQRNDMTIWSSPVVGQNVRDFSPETLIYRFWTYNENQRTYQPLFENGLYNPTDYTFEKGKGIAIRSRFTLLENEFEAYPGKFVGNLNNGTLTVPVVYTTTGFNMLGNPYPSSLNTMDFLNMNPTVSTIYFWTHQYPVGSVDYGNNYATYTLAGANTPSLDDNISVGQGFIIKTTQNANVVFNNSMRNNTSSAFLRNESIERNRIWLGFTENNIVRNDILISYMTGATNGFDSQYDGKRMQAGGSAMYTILDDEAYLVQGRALPFSTEDIIPLGFESPNGGTFEINITAKDGLFNEGQEVFLFDRLLNTIHNLTTAPYSFTSEAGVFNNRFDVLFANRSLDVKDLLNQEVKVFKDGDHFIVESMKSKIVAVELIDVQGRKVFSQSKLNTNRFQVNTAAKGVLIVKIETENGEIITKKVLK